MRFRDFGMDCVVLRIRFFVDCGINKIRMPVPYVDEMKYGAFRQCVCMSYIFHHLTNPAGAETALAHLGDRQMCSIQFMVGVMSVG